MHAEMEYTSSPLAISLPGEFCSIDFFEIEIKPWLTQ
jgi:hypothetical protein